MFSNKLSSDLSVYILSFLPLQDFIQLYSLSRKIKEFLVDNEDALYHQLAVLHRFVAPGVTIEDAVAAETRSGGDHLKDVRTWKQLCRQSVILDRNWSGRGTVVQGAYACFEDAVQKFVIDEDHNLIIIKSATNVLSVYTQDGSELIWSLPGVVNLALSGRFLLLWRTRNPKDVEIWRFEDIHEAMVQTITRPSPLAATELQLEESNRQDQGSTSRRYVAHGYVSSPERGWTEHAFREPYLAVVTMEQPHVVQIYDIVRGVLHQVVDLDSILINEVSDEPHRALFAILFDLQLSDKYLYAGFDAFFVLVKLRQGDSIDSDAITTGVNKDAVVYDDSEETIAALQCSPRLIKATTDVGAIHPPRGTMVQHGNIQYTSVAGSQAFEEFVVGPPVKDDPAYANVGQRRRLGICYFSASFSPDQRHLLVMTTFRLVYFFPDVDRLFSGGLAGSEIAQKLHVTEPVVKVQWQGNGRVFAYVDDERDVFLVDLNPTYHTDTEVAEPTLTLHSAKGLRLKPSPEYSGRPRSNVQLRKTGIWFLSDLYDNVSSGPGDEEVAAPDIAPSNASRTTVCFLSFANELGG